ncbi:MAG: hypothetical protein QM731_14740 [Chitinophagaceae bacterium]
MSNTIKVLIAFLLLLSTTATKAQADLKQYLQTHHYAISLESGFAGAVADTLKQKLKDYKLILQAEGGSHYLDFYTRLPITWLRFLNENFGVTHFFLESGHTSDILLNKYLQTGDTGYIVGDKRFWQSLYDYNERVGDQRKLKYFGIDFERVRTYVKALKTLLPATIPPAAINAEIKLIKNANDTLKDCDYILQINNKLQKAIAANRKHFEMYFGDRYSDLEMVVFNKGNCKDVYKNRNNNLAESFLAFDRQFNREMYYGELGEAHTVLINNNFASKISNSAAFKNKVCVVNLYCYNCTTPQEAVSNWPLAKIEKELLQQFLPFCTADFTLFDLTGSSELVKKYAAYGQFLIIAKEQH